MNVINIFFVIMDMQPLYWLFFCNVITSIGRVDITSSGILVAGDVFNSPSSFGCYKNEVRK